MAPGIQTAPGSQAVFGFTFGAGSLLGQVHSRGRFTSMVGSLPGQVHSHGGFTSGAGSLPSPGASVPRKLQ